MAVKIDAQEFRTRHAALVKVLAQLEAHAADLKEPYSPTLIFHIRRGLYRVEKSTRRMSLQLVPKLAFELEAYIARLADEKTQKLSEDEVKSCLHEGNQLISKALQALARGETEATEEAVPLFQSLLEKIQAKHAKQSTDLQLVPSQATVSMEEDELDSFERSLQAMQQDLQGVVANKSPNQDQ